MRRVEGVLVATSFQRGRRFQNVYVLAPWREGGRVEWSDLRVVGPDVDEATATAEMMRIGRTGAVLALEVETVGGRFPAMVTRGPAVLLSLSPLEAGFPDAPPGFEFPANFAMFSSTDRC